MRSIRPEDLGIGRLFWAIAEAVVVADAATGRIVLWNPAAAALLGYSADEARALTVDVLVPDRLRGRHRAGLARYDATGHGPLIDGGAPAELPARRKDGAEVPIELTLTPLDAAGGRYVLAFIRPLPRGGRGAGGGGGLRHAPGGGGGGDRHPRGGGATSR